MDFINVFPNIWFLSFLTLIYFFFSLKRFVSWPASWDLQKTVLITFPIVFSTLFFQWKKKAAAKQVRQKMVSLNNPYLTRTERTKWLGWYRLWNRLNEAEGRWKLSVFRRLSKERSFLSFPLLEAVSAEQDFVCYKQRSLMGFIFFLFSGSLNHSTVSPSLPRVRKWYTRNWYGQVLKETGHKKMKTVKRFRFHILSTDIIWGKTEKESH